MTEDIQKYSLFIKNSKIFLGRILKRDSKTRNVELELNKIRENTAFAKKLGLNCHAGHGLTFENVSAIASISDIVELNIGHFIIANSVFYGLENSILKMREIISKAVK